MENCSSSKDTTAITMGRGTLYLMVSGIIFTLSGYAVNIVLGRYFGPQNYGVYGVIIAIMTIVNLVLTTGIPCGTSKFISERKKWDKDLRKKSLQTQAAFSIVIAGAYFLLSPLIAKALNDSSLIYYLRISAFIIPFYALNSMYREGFLNGYKRFKEQAITQTGFSVVKVSVVFALVLFGLGVTGAIMGYLCAALVGFLIGFYYLKTMKLRGTTEKDDAFSIKKLIQFAVPMIIYSAGIFLIFNIDLLSVKAILQENIDTGFYTSTTNIARIPYFIFGGLALTLLPSISYSSSQNDLLQTQDYITKSLRYMVMLLTPSVLLISVTAQPLVVLFYGGQYVTAGEPLQLLIIGLGCFAVFNVLSHIVMGSGKPGVASGTAIAVFVLALMLNLYFIPMYGLSGAALATTIASIVGMVTVAWYVYNKFKALMNPVSFGKIMVASLITYAIAYVVPVQGILLMVAYLALFGLYLALLWLVNEIKKEDIETAKRILQIKLPKVGH